MNKAQQSIIIIEGLKPSIPDALVDGLVPTAALTPGLLACAPLVTAPGYSTRPGDVFELVVDGTPVAESRVTYAGPDTSDVELTLPSSTSANLEDGRHRMSFLVHMKIGDTLASDDIEFQLDRRAPGGGFLPRMELPWSIHQNGLSLATLVSLPDQELTAKIPAYPYMEPTDTIHVVGRLSHGTGRIEKTVAAVADAEYTVISFTRGDLEGLGGNGLASFTYRVKDRAGNMSVASYAATIKLLLAGAPETLQAIRVPASQGAVITDQAIKPSLTIEVPAMETAAAPGDLLSLYIGGQLVQQIQITASDAQTDPIATFKVSYERVWSDFEAAHDAAPTEFHYVHMRDRVSSVSESSFYRIDLSVPGGRDPNPLNDHSEALPKPILRGQTGKQDNHITYKDAEDRATIHIPGSPMRGENAVTFEPGDRISAFIGTNEVGSVFEVKGTDAPIELSIPTNDLKKNSGFGILTYTASRALSDGQTTSVAMSPPQPIRIDTIDSLPGAGKPLAPAIFTAGRAREEDGSVYGLFATDFTDDVTPVRVFGYANIAAGDTICIKYEGFDEYEGGKPVDGAKGEIFHEVSFCDLLPKVVPDPATGDLIYVDIDFPIHIAKRVAHGHIEYHHEVTNDVGVAKSSGRDLLIRVRV